MSGYLKLNSSLRRIIFERFIDAVQLLTLIVRPVEATVVLTNEEYKDSKGKRFEMETQFEKIGAKKATESEEIMVVMIGLMLLFHTSTSVTTDEHGRI